jgi:hypothetical protein
MSTANSYSTGYKGTILVNSTTYTNAQGFDLPDYTARTIDVFTFLGLQVLPDGIAGYGEPMFQIPIGPELVGALATVSLTDTTLSALTFVAPPVTATGFAGFTWVGGTNNCYVISDSLGKVKRGSATIREVRIKLLNNPGSFTSP